MALRTDVSALYKERLVKPQPLYSTSCVGAAVKPGDVNLVLYHGQSCPDGFASAWAARRLLGDKASYVAMEHGAAPPDVAGKHVVVVDFCFSRDVTAALMSSAASFLVLDHHASAEAAMAGLPSANKVFEMQQSGATLAYDFFHAGEPCPLALRYLEDKDIWRWALRDSEAFSAGFGALPLTFEALDELHEGGAAAVDAIIDRGRAILDYKRGVVESHVRRAVPCRLRAAPQFGALIVNGSTQASEIGNALCQVPGAQLGVIWNYDHGKKVFSVSLRSDSDAVDVSIIAASLGGGGHRRAAGFTFRGAHIEDLLVSAEPPGAAAGGAAAGGAAAGGAAAGGAAARPEAKRPRIEESSS